MGIAKLIKGLLYKQRNLNLAPSTYIESQVQRCVLLTIALGRRWQEDPWRSLAIQSRRGDELQIQGETLIQKIRWKGPMGNSQC